MLLLELHMRQHVGVIVNSSISQTKILIIIFTVCVTAPQNFDVALDGTVLSASWDAPEDENVISYTLNCSVDGEDVLSLETTLLEVSVGVYRTSTTYSCTVYATTSNGDGTPTDAMSVTTGGKKTNTDWI